jgi:hypothetical protein
MDEMERIRKVEQEETVAVTGSPNTTAEIAFDVLERHMGDPLDGGFFAVDVPVNGGDLRVLGQAFQLQTTNEWHEGNDFKNLIKSCGRVPNMTADGDVTHGVLGVVGAYRVGMGNTLEKGFLGTPPGSGLAVRRVCQKDVEGIMEGESGYGYLGTFYRSGGVPAPVFARHYGPVKDGGTGEAHMGIVLGPSGSGKSVMAAELLCLHAMQAPMGILILDPQSQFAENDFGRETDFGMDFHALLSVFSGGRFNSARDVVRLDHLRLDGLDVFLQILKMRGFFEGNGMGSGKTGEAAMAAGDLLEMMMKEHKTWRPGMSWARTNEIRVPTPDGEKVEFMEALASWMVTAYVNLKDRPERTSNVLEELRRKYGKLGTIWDETSALFDETRVSVDEVLKDCCFRSRIVILELNPRNLSLGEDLKLYLMDLIFRRLRKLGHESFFKDPANRPNVLIAMDEAGRFIAQHPDSEWKSRISSVLTQSVKELRKYRIGFLFITQTISEIQKDVYRNLHYRIYGAGCGVGTDLELLREREAEEAVALYRTLPDQRQTGKFSFLVAGSLVALGTQGRPMVIEGFPSGASFREINRPLVEEALVHRPGKPDFKQGSPATREEDILTQTNAGF